MTVVNIATGEVVNTMGADEARRLTTEAREQFRTASDHADRGWDLIEQAVKGGGHFDLGYKSPGEYLRAEFEGTLRGLEVETRRRAVATMTDWGLSSRAIAPVIGISDRQTRRDQVGHVSRLTQSTPAAAPTSLPTFGEHMATFQTSCGTSDITAPQDPPSAGETTEGAGTPEPPAPRPPVVGIDGKTYTRPTPKPTPEPQSGTDEAVEYVGTVARNLTVLSQLGVPQRRADLIAAWPLALGKVSPAMTDRFTPEQMRAVADGLHDLADEWESRNV